MASARAYAHSHRSVFLGLATVAGYGWLSQLRFLLILLFLALMSSSSAAGGRLADAAGARSPTAALLLILLFLAILAGVITYFVPQVDETGALFVNDLPNNLVRLSETTGIRIPHQAEAINQALNSSLQTAITITTTTLGILFSIFAVATIGYYGLSDYDKLWRWIGGLPGVSAKRAREVEANLESRLGGWVRGQVILSTVIGVLDIVLFAGSGCRSRPCGRCWEMASRSFQWSDRWWLAYRPW